MGVCASSVNRLKEGGGVTGKVTNDWLFRALFELSRQIYFDVLQMTRSKASTLPFDVVLSTLHWLSFFLPESFHEHEHE